jgi:hypothetical protein
MGIILAFHSMRFEDQMVSDPNGIETVGLRLFRSFDTSFGGAILAKMRQQQSELQLGSHRYAPFFFQTGAGYGPYPSNS